MAGKGSTPGEHRGGRKAGTPNKASAAKAAQIEASGLTPLDFMLQVLRDKKADMHTRFEAAKAAAPYVHPKFAPTEQPKPDDTKAADMARPTGEDTNIIDALEAFRRAGAKK